MAIFDDTTSLRRDSSGEKVKTLQTHLKTLGYYSKAIDGEYGYYTEEAVKSFQRANNLTVDGWFGPQTAKKFNSVMEARTTVQATTETKKTTKETDYPFDCPNTNLVRDSTDKDKVTKLQTILKALGYYTRQVDGDFGEYTEKAVKEYQKTQPTLLVDGEFGPITCQKMAVTYNEKVKPTLTQTATKKQTLADLPTVPPYSKLVIHPEVVVLPETELNVSTSTGSDGSKTVSTSVSLVGGSIDATTNFDCSKISLKKGSSGDDVKKLQTILKARGYYTRQIDGEYGDYTVAAVKRLQQVQGNEQDGWFGEKTCKKLQGTSSTSSDATGTKDKKNKDYTIDDWSQNPSFTDDIEGISHELTLKTPYTPDKLSHMRKLQKTTFTMMQDKTELYKHMGYIKEIKISQEDADVFIELSITGFTEFLNQTVEGYEKTAKRSALLKELIGMAGLKADVDLSGLNDDEYTIKAQKVQTTTTSSEGGAGLTEVHGNDCTPTASIRGSFTFDLDKCKAGTKIGDSSANYAQDTKHMSAKQAIQDLFRRFRYGYRGRGGGYSNNLYCPKSMWNKDGTIWGNCADAARLTKCLGEVHGLKVGIHHWTNGSIGHYFNVIEVNGKVYRFDCCFGSSGYSTDYGNELCNNLTKNGGPWQ